MTRMKVLPGIALILFAFSFAGIARAGGAFQAEARPLILTEGQDEYPLGLYLDILEDPGGELTVEEVSSPAYEDQFTRSRSLVPVFGFTDSAYWTRIEIRNETSRTDDWFLDVVFPNLQYIDLYAPRTAGDGFVLKQAGVLRSPSLRDFRYPRAIFTVAIPPQGQETIYMRFQSGSSMTLNLKLWSQQAFVNHTLQEQIAYGLFFGILIGLFFYNLFVAVSLQEASYYACVFLLACMILHEASYNGFLEIYVNPSLFSYKSSYHPVLFTLMIISMILFPDTFLDLKKRIPKLHTLVLASMIIGGILVLLIPFVSYRRIAVLLLVWALISLLVIWVAGLYYYVRGRLRPAPLFMIVWFVLVALIMNLLLVRLGVMPSTFFSETVYRLGILLVAILWSISLADRVNMMKSETEKVNQELYNSQRRLTEILEGLPVGVAVFGPDHEPKFVNRRTGEILGNLGNSQPQNGTRLALAQAIEHFSLKLAGTNERYPLENMPIYKALEGTSAYTDDIEANIDGRRVPMEMWASPVTDSEGNIELAVAAFQDITQRKQEEAELIAYRRQLESLVENRTADLNATNKELRLRLDWLAAVNLVNQMIARSEDFPLIYGKVLEIINQLFDTSDSFIAELDASQEQLTILAHTCHSDSHADLIGSTTYLHIYIQFHSILETTNFFEIAKEDLSSLSGPMGMHVRDSSVVNVALFPLQVREKVLGFLGLEMCEEGKSISPEELNMLAIFSTDIAQLIEDARLFEQAKLLVAVEERNRLARELHDSVAQTLYSTSLFINATRLALQGGKIEVVQEYLEELAKLSKEAMADMRLLIFELRPPVLEKSGLVTALKTRLESVEAKAGFQAHYETEGVISLSAAQESELYRIAQEALNNIIKHAGANRVNVRLACEADRIRLTIEDDGVGFDPLLAENRGGQGLRNIQERATRIGASCAFESTPGQGTKLTIEVKQ